MTFCLHKNLCDSPLHQMSTKQKFSSSYFPKAMHILLSLTQFGSSLDHLIRKLTLLPVSTQYHKSRLAQVVVMAPMLIHSYVPKAAECCFKEFKRCLCSASDSSVSKSIPQLWQMDLACCHSVLKNLERKYFETSPSAPARNVQMQL